MVSDALSRSDLNSLCPPIAFQNRCTAFIVFPVATFLTQFLIILCRGVKVRWGGDIGGDRKSPSDCVLKHSPWNIYSNISAYSRSKLTHPL